MKNYVIPYAVCKKKKDSEDFSWSTNIDFYNHNNSPTIVKIDIQRSDGKLSASLAPISIDPYGHYILLAEKIYGLSTDPSGRITILISVSEDVMITPILWSPQGIMKLDVHEVTTLGK